MSLLLLLGTAADQTPAPAARGLVTPTPYDRHRAVKRRRILAAAVAVLVLPFDGRTVPSRAAAAVPLAFGVAATGAPGVAPSRPIGVIRPVDYRAHRAAKVDARRAAVVRSVGPTRFAATQAAAGAVPVTFGVTASANQPSTGAASIPITFGVLGESNAIVTGTAAVPITFAVVARDSTAPIIGARGITTPVRYDAHRRAKAARLAAYAPQLLVARQFPQNTGRIPISFSIAATGTGASPGQVAISFGVTGSGALVNPALAVVPLTFGVVATGQPIPQADGEIPISFGVVATTVAPPANPAVLRGTVRPVDYRAHRAAQRARREAYRPQVIVARQYTPAITVPAVVPIGFGVTATADGDAGASTGTLEIAFGVTATGQGRPSATAVVPIGFGVAAVGIGSPLGPTAFRASTDHGSEIRARTDHGPAFRVITSHGG
jgi:hypothetical protein